MSGKEMSKELQYKDIIQEKYHLLSPSERKVADYALENMSTFLRMSVDELKDNIGVSGPTVLRFCRSLGYEGLKDFRISMAQHMRSYKEYFYDDGDRKSGMPQLVERILREEAELIGVTMRCMDMEALDRAAELIVSSPRVCFFGVGTSADICHDAMRKLIRLNKSAWAFDDLHDAVMLLSVLTPEDLIFCVSHSGRTAEVADMLRLGRKKGVPTILMTSFPDEKMKAENRVVLRTYAKEDAQSRLGLLTRIGQYAVFDALYMAVISRMHENAVEFMEQTTRDLMSR